MAQKITLKRVIQTDGSTDDLFPTTTLDQIYTVDGNGDITATSLSTYLDDTFIPLSQKGANSGVATLTSSGKLTTSQVPDYLLGGLKFIGTVSDNGDYGRLSDLITGLPATSTVTVSQGLDDVSGYDYNTQQGLDDYEANYKEYVGYYWVVGGSAAIGLEAGQNSDGSAYFAPSSYDDGVATTGTSTYFFEPGDWIVITDWDSTLNTNNGGWTVSTINNTYGNATNFAKGVVQLSNATNAGEYNASTNTGGLVDGATEVITENFLFDNIASGEMNGGASGANNVLNKIASTNHLHDGRYYTETEIDNWIAGTSSINSKNFTEIIYGSTPSSTTVGTILIDID